MKTYLTSLIFLILSNVPVMGQPLATIKSQISGIKTAQQAKDYLAQHNDVQGELLEVNSRTDTTDFYKDILKTVPGSLIEFKSDDGKKHFIFKTLEIGDVKSFRVQYIFLDNKKLSITQIDSIRNILLKRLDHGETFDALAMKYSMDGNAKKGGDLGWFAEGMMRKEFEDKIRSNKTGAIFMVDIPTEKWYYMVKNSYAPRIDKKITVLYLEIDMGS